MIMGGHGHDEMEGALGGPSANPRSVESRQCWETLGEYTHLGPLGKDHFFWGSRILRVNYFYILINLFYYFLIRIS